LAYRIFNKIIFFCFSCVTILWALTLTNVERFHHYIEFSWIFNMAIVGHLEFYPSTFFHLTASTVWLSTILASLVRIFYPSAKIRLKIGNLIWRPSYT